MTQALDRLETLLTRLEAVLGRLESSRILWQGDLSGLPPPSYTPEEAKKAQEAADKYVQSRKEALFDYQKDEDG